MNLKYTLLFFALLPFSQLQAQPEKLLAENTDRYAGIYHSYEPPHEVLSAAPKGYTPFYISHYGRHGSRWHSSEKMYMEPLMLLREAEGCQALTPVGRDLLSKLEHVAADAEGRWGDLSPRGVREHRGIAERMYRNFPEVFSTRKGRACNIESRSTVVIRCVLSMAAFGERLKELNPDIRITRESSQRYMPYMNNGEGRHEQRPRAMIVGDSVINAWVKPDRFLASVFADGGFVTRKIKDPQRVMYQYYLLAAIMQDVDYLGISLFDLFTHEELETLWRAENVYRYLTMGPSARFGDPMVADAKPLLKNIVESADAVIEGRSDLSATLRFGHDSNVVPLMALIGVKECCNRVYDVEDVAENWNVSMVTPMATNLQLIFYRNDKKEDDVRVRLLHNERDAVIPVDGAPFYCWKDLKAYFQRLYE